MKDFADLVDLKLVILLSISFVIFNPKNPYSFSYFFMWMALFFFLNFLLSIGLFLFISCDSIKRAINSHLVTRYLT